MGTRNFSLGTRDMKAAGRIALQRSMLSFDSVGTMADRWNLFVDYVREHHSIGRMENITKDIVICYGDSVAYRVEEELLAISTAQNYVSVVNRVMEIARGDRTLQVSPTRDCGIPKRTGIATVDLAMSEEVHHSWLTVVDPRLAILLRLQRAFGLRFEESAKFDARTAQRDMNSGWIWVVDGTKGGRNRKVPVLVEEQRQILDRAAEIQGKDRSMIPAEMSYKDFRRDCYQTAARHGIRFHRERHTYVHSRYKTLVGGDCPVVAHIAHGNAHIAWLAEIFGLSIDATKERDAAARDLIAQELGHNRRGVTNAYLG